MDRMSPAPMPAELEAETLPPQLRRAWVNAPRDAVRGGHRQHRRCRRRGRCAGLCRAGRAGSELPHKHDLLAYATHLRNLIPGLRMPGTARAKAGVISFVIDGMDNVVIGKALNQDGIAVRAGHHCASLSSVVSASNHRCARRLHSTTRMPTLKHWQCLSGASAPVPLVSPERPGTDREIPPMASPGFGCQAPVSRDL